MPMPSSRDAPKFTGKNLREFLADYEIGTGEAGWSEDQKCKQLPLYCSRKVRDLVSTYEEVISGQHWSTLKRRLLDSFHPEYFRPRYSRRDIEKFVKKKRSITKRGHFAEYYRDFLMRIKYIKPKPLSKEDCDLLFWEGLPRHLQKDIYDDLKVSVPNLDRSVAQDIEVIKKIALATLDKDSVYSRVTHTRSISNSYEKADSEDDRDSRRPSSKSKRKKSSKDLYGSLKKDSDDDSGSDSDDESDSDSESGSDDSSNSEDESWTRHKRKKSVPKVKKESASEERRYTKKDVIRRIVNGKEPSDPQVEQLTEEIKRLTLQLDAQKKASSDRSATGPVTGTGPGTTSENQVARLTEEVRNLAQQVTDAQMPRRQNQQLYDPNGPRSGPALSRHCWFCKRTDSHPQGLRNCPTCIKLIKEGLLVDNGYRISLPDGGRLPSLPHNGGESMEEFLRRIYGPPQDLPQHGRASSAVMIEPPQSMYNYNRQASNGDWLVMDAERPERPNVRFNPIARPDNRATRSPSQGRPYVEIPARPKPPGPVRVLIPPPPTSVRPDTAGNDPSRAKIGPPKPPIIMKRPVEIKQPSAPKERMNNIPDDDIEMIDAPVDKPKDDRVYTPRTPPKMQFTTDLRRKVNIQQVMTQIYDQEVKLPLGIILGISGEVSKELNSATRTHKDYVGKSAEYPKEARSVTRFDSDSDYYSDDEADYSDDSEWDDYQFRAIAHTTGVNELKRMLDRNLYAMGTGKLDVKVGNAEGISGMIDTGSELNLISRRLQEQLGLPMDPAGSAWGIRGVNGGPESLHGCCRRVPIEIGGLRFDHIFFVKNGNIGHDYDLLMGQPWLKAAAAEISYGGDKKDSMRIRIYEHGDVTKNSLIVNLSVDHKREATRLVHHVEQIREVTPDDSTSPATNKYIATTVSDQLPPTLIQSDTNLADSTPIDRGGMQEEPVIDLGAFFDLANRDPPQEDPLWEKFELLSVNDTLAQDERTILHTIDEIDHDHTTTSPYRERILQSVQRHRRQQRRKRIRRNKLVNSYPVILERRRVTRNRPHSSQNTYREDILVASENPSDYPPDDDSPASSPPHNDIPYLPGRHVPLYYDSSPDDPFVSGESSDEIEEILDPVSSSSSSESEDDLPRERPHNTTPNNEMYQQYYQAGAEPSENVELKLEPSIPSLGRKLSEAL